MSKHELNPKLKEWLDSVIVPALVEEYLSADVGKKTIAAEESRVSKSRHHRRRRKQETKQ